MDRKTAIRNRLEAARRNALLSSSTAHQAHTRWSMVDAPEDILWLLAEIERLERLIATHKRQTAATLADANGELASLRLHVIQGEMRKFIEVE